ncbi:MAG: 5'/3'-nucleotidase SurE [Chroococcidiopsidaceae cyanobacterium CP_BM_RX_35]|nr:5'/3'-nucleotidase SurE [Chroococcidiopsidaceae cyanobacterium CP_BM_RX_35]
MIFVLTNDDGIDAPGIQALWKAMNGKGLIVAPRDHLSGCGHQVTTTRPIHVQRRSSVEYAVAGTPADCVRLAISHLCPDVQLVLSGINAGGNLGVDAYISGTVAAVREAAMHRIAGIAVSHYRRGKRNVDAVNAAPGGSLQENVDWDVAAHWTSSVLADLLNRSIAPGTFWNVNLPHLEPGDPDPKIVFCEPSTNSLPLNYRLDGEDFYYIGEYAKRDRSPGTDVDVCFSGHIAVTQLRL